MTLPTPPVPLGSAPDDEALIGGVRAGDSAAVVAWMERDHPIAEFLCAVADGQPGDGCREVLATAWRSALTDIASSTPTAAPRTVLLREVIYALDDAGRLDTDPRDTVAPAPGPYLPDGDPWADWWVDDDAVRPLTAGLRRTQVVAALRRLPLVSRVLLVACDGGRLPLAEAAALVNGSGQQLDGPLSAARIGYLSLIDEQVNGGETR